MNVSVLEYIKNEKDIAKYNLQVLLKKDYSKPHIRRLIEIEKEFIKTPFESMSFETTPDVATAIAIYRKSRNDFYKIYNVQSVKQILNIDVLLKTLYGKKAILKKLSDDVIWKKIESINAVQDSEIFEELVQNEASRTSGSYSKVFSELEKMSLDELLKIEPVKISKKRARLQILLFSIVLTLKSLIEIIPEFDENSSPLDINQTIQFLDFNIDNLQHIYFKYYNISIDILSKMLNDSIGRNYYLEKMHKLVNLADFPTSENVHVNFNDEEYYFIKPEIMNLVSTKAAINFDITKDKEKNIQNKTFGILLPVDRRGNEKLSLLYKEVFIDDVDITGLFCDTLSNIRVFFNSNETYYKSILIKPMWQIYQEKNSRAFAKLFSKILNEKEEDILDNAIYTDSFKNKLNNATNFRININYNSKILVPKTRSEEEAFSGVMGKMDEVILEIQREYYLKKEEEYEV